MTHAQQTRAVKIALNNDNAFKALMAEWQRASAKGQTRLSFAGYYKAKRKTQKQDVEALVNSWFVA
jgi:hypothetical protein